METTYRSTIPVADSNRNEADVPGISWAAVLAGGVVAAALSLALMALGSGLGLSSISPWANDGASAKTIGVAAVVWMILMQSVSAGLGGYMAGRLRTKWVGLHSEEVAFRDTSHGFFVWALGVVLTAGLLTTAMSGLVGGAAKIGGAAVSATGEAVGAAGAEAVQQGVARPDSNGYFVDSLFRSENPSDDTDAGSTRTESTRIFANALRHGEMPAADRTYLAKIVAAKTGLSQADAEKRVSDAVSQARNAAAQAEQTARQTADEARKAAARLSFATCLALLIGAFSACLAATWGGRHRDAGGV